MTRELSYITVAMDDEGMKQSTLLFEKMHQGFEIISAVGTGTGVHYILEKKS